MVEGVPGRTKSRQIFACQEGIVYHLTFYPVDRAFPQAAPDVEEFWLALELMS